MAKEIDIEARFAALAENNQRLAEQNAKLMAALEAKIEPATGGGIGPEQLEQILSKVTAAAGKTSELIAAQHKVEYDHLQRGPFEHPEGGIKYPKPDLAREIVFGRPLPTSELTYAEVLACNALSASLGRSQRRLARNGKWKAVVSDDDARVTISIPVKTIDDRQDLPSFIEILRELTTGEREKDTVDILSELALVKSELARLQTAHA